MKNEKKKITTRNFMVCLSKYTFKYHVSCTDGKISVGINLLFYLFLHRPFGWDDGGKIGKIIN